MILLVSAVREELGDLPGEPLGIGPVVAAARMARILALQRPGGVVFVGSCGAYPDGPPIGSATKSRRLGLMDGVALMGLGYTPRPPANILGDARLLARIEAVEVDVLTVGAVTTDALLMGRLSDGWQVEHLEAFGAAQACADAEVPFVAVLGVANWVGPNAHTEWLAHRGRAQTAARAAVSGLVAG